MGHISTPAVAAVAELFSRIKKTAGSLTNPYGALRVSSPAKQNREPNAVVLSHYRETAEHIVMRNCRAYRDEKLQSIS
jgi:hypothetical protein